MALKNEKKTKTTFGAFIRKMRKGKGLTQLQLAIEAGITPSYVCCMERGSKTNVESIRVWNGLKIAFGWNDREMNEAMRLMEHCDDAARAAGPAAPLPGESAPGWQLGLSTSATEAVSLHGADLRSEWNAVGL